MINLTITKQLLQKLFSSLVSLIFVIDCPPHSCAHNASQARQAEHQHGPLQHHVNNCVAKALDGVLPALLGHMLGAQLWETN